MNVSVERVICFKNGLSVIEGFFEMVDVFYKNNGSDNKKSY